MLSCFCVYGQNQNIEQIDFNSKSPIELEKLSDQYLSEKKYAESLICLKKAAEKNLQLKLENNAGRLYKKQGLIYSQINDFDMAMASFIEAQELFVRNKDLESLIEIKLEIGEIFGKLSQCDNAFRNLFEAYKIHPQIKVKNKENLIRNYTSLGIVYGSCGNLDSALFFFERSRELFIDTNSISYCGVLNNIGAIYSKKEDNLRALNYYNRALTLFKLLKSELGESVTNSNIAYIYKKQENYHEAIELYLKAINYFKSSNSLLYLKDNLLNLSVTYEIIGDYKSALKYNNMYLDIHEKVTNAEILSRLNDLQMQNDIRKKENELVILEQKNKVAAFRLNMLIYGIVLISVIAVLIVRTLKMNLKNTQLKQEVLKQEKLQLNKNIELKNKELETLILKFIEKNEFLEKLKINLKKISSEDHEANMRIKEISAIIHSNLNADKDRKEFEMQLDEAHQSFFLKLNNLNAALTEYEKRLCSLLVLNLKTKDIAVILNISPDSVKKSKYRLRKKLDLNNEKNLTSFLQTI